MTPAICKAEMLKYGFRCTHEMPAGKNLKSWYLTFENKDAHIFKIRISDHPAAIWRTMDSDLYNDLYLDISDPASKVRPFYFGKKIEYSKHPRAIELSETDILALTGKPKPRKTFLSKTRGDKYQVLSTRISKAGKQVYFCYVYNAQKKKEFFKKIK